MSDNPPKHLPEIARECSDSTIASSHEIIDALRDRYTRKILYELADENLTGSEIHERVGFSKTTVYRRLDALEELNVVSTTLRIDPDGHHANVYILECEEIQFDMDEESSRPKLIQVGDGVIVQDQVGSDAGSD